MKNILHYFLSHPSVWAGVCLLFCAFINHRHAEKQQDEAFNMPESNETDRLCRQIRLLETRIWLQTWWIIAAIAIGILFINK
jgi:hypothetical protein